MLAALPELVSKLGTDDAAGLAQATAMTTTDLASKSAALTIDVGGVTVSLGGCAKGSGMIHPNMATMLGTVTCDAAVEPALWRQLVRTASTKSFNQVRTAHSFVSLFLSRRVEGGERVVGMSVDLTPRFHSSSERATGDVGFRAPVSDCPHPAC